ncbi:MAG: DUF4476 domain-containing protein, partial [Chitinophagales bacterium]
MTNAELEKFIVSVNDQSFDADKVKQIQTFLTPRCLMASQIARIVSQITFEESKLNIAKSLFDNCSDKQNYYLVIDGFRFSDSKNKMNDYIKSKQ